jgi:hypothetical protein
MVAWTYVRLLYPGIPQLDPYVEWALGPGRNIYFPDSDRPGWIPVVLRLAGIKPREFAEGGDFIDPSDKPNWRRMVMVAPLFLERNEEGYGPALVTEPFFKVLETNGKLRELVPELRLSASLPDDSFPPLRPSGS